MAAIAKKSMLWGVVAFLCLVLFLAARNGAAQLFSLSARADMDAWSEQKRSPSESEISSVISKLEWAVRLADMDSNTHKDIAKLSLIRAFYSSDAMQRQQILRGGLHEIRVALALSPASPYHWTYLLILKRDLGEFDAEFRHALRRAVETGPWEPTLLVAQADVGLSAWKVMPPEEQAIIQQIFIRGMQRQSKAMRAVVQSHRSACAEGVTCQ
jgi:hypothetical protein